jgi:hypothetical protein
MRAPAGHRSHAVSPGYKPGPVALILRGEIFDWKIEADLTPGSRGAGG